MSPARTAPDRADPVAPANDKPTLMLLDGNSLAFRAFYALPAENFKTRGGLTTNADQPRACAGGGVAKSATPRDAKRERQKADLADELTTLREAIEQFLDKLESL